jgi:hypothetical protein
VTPDPVSHPPARRPLLACLIAVLLLGATAAAAGPPTPGQAPTAQVAGDAAWCWFSEPRAVQSGATTYFGWISSRGDITVGSYDTSTGQSRSAVLMTGFEVDDHDHPAVLLRPDGKLQAFWSGHNGDQVFTRTSLRIRDVSAWGPLRSVPVRVPGDRVSTYVNPVVLSAERNRLYVFARSGYSHQSFTSTADDGRTWTTARTLIEAGDQRPYVKYASDGRATIGMAFTNGHPAETQTSIYYAAYRGGALRRASGMGIAPVSALPIAPAQADLVFRAPSGRDAWVHDVALDAQGRPRIVFATFADGNAEDHDYWYAGWTGSRWETRRITAAGGSISDDARQPSYSGGISLDHSDPSVVVLSRPGLQHFEVERWRTADLGRTWSSEAVTVASTQDNVRPVVPRNGSGRVVWMTGRYGYFTTFRTAAATDGVVLPQAPLPTSLAGAATQGAKAFEVVGTLSLSGVVSVGSKELTLQSRPVGWRTWRNVSTAPTGTQGRAKLLLPHRRGLEYRWVWPGDHELARSESTPFGATT